jgi:DNA-directed RNA polymerase alpha subunit
MVKHYSELSSEELEVKLGTHLHDLGLSPSEAGTLDSYGIYTLNDLLHCTKADLLSMNNMGEKKLQNIMNAIRRQGFY